VEAWSPIGQGVLLEDAAIGRVAAAHQKTVAQVTLRWHVQHGHIIFPKSLHRERMQENLGIFDFALSGEEMAALDGLDRGERGRTGPNPDTFAPRL
jgi:2,5-diketo-D-gluconate reductase A